MDLLHSEPVDINLNTPIMSVKSKPHEILYYSCLLNNYYKKYYIRMQNYNKFVEYMYNLRSNLKYIDVNFQKIVDPEIGEYAYILPRIPDKYKISCNFDNITIGMVVDTICSMNLTKPYDIIQNDVIIDLKLICNS